MFSLLTPHHRVRCVWELTPERLQFWGLRALLLDVDCTLARYRHEEALPEVRAWLEQMRLSGVGLCLVSNGLSGRIERFAQRLGVPYVSRAMKPFPWGVRTAVRLLECPPFQVAIVGDQLFADILAGRLAGIRCILVDPIHPEEEPWFTRLKRLPERWLLRRLYIVSRRAPAPQEPIETLRK